MGQNLPYFGGSTSTYDFRYCLGTTLLTIGKKQNMLLSSIPLYPHLFPMVHPSGSNASPLLPSYKINQKPLENVDEIINHPKMPSISMSPSNQ
jgi:hypothetical protein